MKYVKDPYQGMVLLKVRTGQPDGLGRHETGQVYSGSKGLFTVSNAARRIAADPDTVWCQITETGSAAPGRLFYSHGQPLIPDRDLVPACPGCGPAYCRDPGTHYFGYEMWEPFAELAVPGEWTRLIASAQGSTPDRRCPDVFIHYLHGPHPWAVIASTPEESQTFTCVGLPS
jgi:hypothetical protein